MSDEINNDNITTTMEDSPTSPSSPKVIVFTSPSAAPLDPALFHGNTTNAVVSLEDPKKREGAAAGDELQWSAFYREQDDVFGDFYSFELQQKLAVDALSSASLTGAMLNTSAAGAKLADAMNTITTTIPKGSATIAAVTAAAQKNGGGGGGNGARQLSARQLSGQLDDEVARSWDEDWEDEDVDDGFDVIMGKIAKGASTVAVGE